MTSASAPLWIDIPNACSAAPGICSGGRPQPHHLQQARDRGVRTVVSLCPPGEAADYDEAAMVAALGMQFLNIPVAGPQDLTRANAERLAEALRAAGPDHPVLLHCASGNRVGALVALKAFLVDGAAPADALQQGRLSGLTALEPYIRQLLGV